MAILSGSLIAGRSLTYGPIYALLLQELDALHEYLDDNIQPFNSPVAAPILFAKKKDRLLRLCIDYRGLNKITCKNCYPLPLIGDLFDQLKDAKVFTALNLQADYNNVCIMPDHEWKTTFHTHYRSFEYLVCYDSTRFSHSPLGTDDVTHSLTLFLFFVIILAYSC